MNRPKVIRLRRTFAQKTRRRFALPKSKKKRDEYLLDMIYPKDGSQTPLSMLVQGYSIRDIIKETMGVDDSYFGKSDSDFNEDVNLEDLVIAKAKKMKYLKSHEKETRP